MRRGPTPTPTAINFGNERSAQYYVFNHHCCCCCLASARSRKFSKSKLLQTDALSDRFEGQNCVDWDLSLLCAALECLLTGQQLENALMGVLAVRDELTNASARTATIAKAKKMEDKCNLA